MEGCFSRKDLALALVSHLSVRDFLKLRLVSRNFRSFFSFDVLVESRHLPLPRGAHTATSLGPLLMLVSSGWKRIEELRDIVPFHRMSRAVGHSVQGALRLVHLTGDFSDGAIEGSVQASSKEKQYSVTAAVSRGVVGVPKCTCMCGYEVTCMLCAFLLIVCCVERLSGVGMPLLFLLRLILSFVGSTQWLSVVLVCASSYELTTCQVYGKKAPPFHAESTAELLFDTVAQMQVRRAIRTLVHALRPLLQSSGHYCGSKLELMDEFGVVLSSFANHPVVFSLHPVDRVVPVVLSVVASGGNQQEHMPKVPWKKKKVEIAVVMPPTSSPLPSRARRTRKQTKHDSEEGYDH